MFRSAIVLLLCAFALSACGSDRAPPPPEGYKYDPDKDFVLDPLVREKKSGGREAK